MVLEELVSCRLFKGLDSARSLRIAVRQLVDKNVDIKALYHIGVQGVLAKSGIDLGQRRLRLGESKFLRDESGVH